MKQTFLALLALMASCSRQPEPAAKAAPESTPPERESSALELYDVSLNTDNVTKGQQINFCFKAKNAVMVTGFPGKFTKNGSPEGDCLIHKPEIDTLYRIEVTGSDGRRSAQSAFVRVRKPQQ